MKTQINISDFRFSPVGHGRYSVTYTSPATKREFNTVITNMLLIDDTKNSDNPKRKDLEWLKYYCKNL